MVVPVVFLAHHVGELLLLGEHPDPRLLKEFREHLVLELLGLCQQVTDVLQHVKPFVLHRDECIPVRNTNLTSVCDDALGTLVGAMLVSTLENGLTICAVPYYVLPAVKGAVLALALIAAYASVKEQ